MIERLEELATGWEGRIQVLAHDGEVDEGFIGLIMPIRI